MQRLLSPAVRAYKSPSPRVCGRVRAAVARAVSSAASDLSYVHGASSAPLRKETIGQCLERQAEEHGSHVALVSSHQRQRLTYEELNHQAERLAAGLLASGVQRGDRVGIWSPNNIEWCIAQYATAKAGMVLVNINPAYRPHELEYALNKVGVTCLITATSFKASQYIEMLADLIPELGSAVPLGGLRSDLVPSLRSVVSIPDHGTGTPNSREAPGIHQWSDLIGAGSDKDVQAVRDLGRVVQFDDAVNIQFTSGTTGAPKGATLSHHNILNNGFFVGERLHYTADDRIVLPVPLYHCMGCVLGNLAALTHGSTMVLPSEGFDATSSLRAISEERGTSIYGVPTMFVDMVNHPDFASFDLSSLRTGIMAGSPCPAALMKRVIEDMGAKDVTICYGMTETSPVSFQTTTTDSIDARVNTVGSVLPHVECKVVDESGAIVPTGQQGELYTRGYSVMLGYWDDDAKTKESIDPARWMHTGDLATLDADGYCRITGRVKDMVIRGGENVYPREIEEFLMHNDKVADVQVFGVPSRRMGEEVAAWVKLRKGAEMTADELKQFCKGEIAHFKVPRYVRFVDEYPMTVTGKIQKFRMREIMVADDTRDGESFD